ncbi:hypothetical protein UCD39_13545 [Nitrospirillum sp. BR 11752]|uniref:hypothetical protein n=1 Tax=Nitrospirillum sp. BR 11752 TaxID=3104293 RepID=UPI002EAFBA7A|nr:hypothetical protein [Nitrospirillum sp. BR 11752]
MPTAAELSSADPAAQQAEAEAELDRQLTQGAHEIVADAAGHRIDRAALPVGQVHNGVSLVEFWGLDAPTIQVWRLEVTASPGSRVDYTDPTSQQLLREMLSVRRLDVGALSALLARIKARQVAAFGPGLGGVKAAMLMARVHQAIERPEDFPGLLSDDELVEAYKISANIGPKFGWSHDLLVGAATTPGSAMSGLKLRKWTVPPWLRRTNKVILFPPVALCLLAIERLLSAAESHYSQKKAVFRDEMLRRNMAIPK